MVHMVDVLVGNHQMLYAVVVVAVVVAIVVVAAVNDEDWLVVVVVHHILNMVVVDILDRLDLEDQDEADLEALLLAEMSLVANEEIARVAVIQGQQALHLSY